MLIPRTVAIWISAYDRNRLFRRNAKGSDIIAKTSSDPIGSSTTREVFTDRINVWFSEVFTTPE